MLSQARQTRHQAVKTFGPLAQLVEQLTLNQRVAGSIPARPTLKSTTCNHSRKSKISGATLVLRFWGLPQKRGHINHCEPPLKICIILLAHF